MIALFLISGFGILMLWVLAIRPYCVANKKGYTTGANYLQVMWIDWQHAKEMAADKKDRGTILICRVFLLLHFTAIIGAIGAAAI